MERKEFEQALSAGTLPSVLLFEGEEEAFKKAALSALRRAILPPGMEEMNETILEAPETDQLIAASETLPFLADRRLIIVRDLPALTGRGEADEKLLAYLPSVPSSSLIVFDCAGKPDGRKKLYAAIKKLGGIVSFNRLRGAELTRFVTDAFREEGKECDQRTAEYLVFTVGPDAGLLRNEISKIAAYAANRPAVLAEDITALATPSTESTVFQMVDAVVSGQSKRAFLLVRNQLLNGEGPAGMLAMLLRQYRLLQHVKIMQFEKRSRDEIREALGLSPYVVDQYLRQASAYTGGQIRKAVSLCLDTEYAFKSGRIAQDSALDALLIRLLALRR